MGKLGRPQVFPDIVEEHFDELDFLWEHREVNVFTPDWNLHDLAEHEERAEAHLDGLRLAELHAIDIALDKLSAGETFAATAAALVLWEGGAPEHRGRVLEVLREGDQPVVDGIRVALRHCPIETAAEALAAIAASAEPMSAAAAADVLAFHRLPVAGLASILAEDGPWIRSLGLAAAGRLGALREPDLVAALQHVEAGVRVSGLREAARCGLPGLQDHCRRAATRSTDPDPEAVAFLGVLGDERDLPLLQTALQRPELAIAAVKGLGASGLVSAVPMLLELIADDALGVVATAAYRRITAADDIEGERPFPPPPVADGEDEEEALPPDPAKARADWRRREPQLHPERAWQAGMPIEPGLLPAGFAELPLESRRDVFLRLRSRARVGDLELEALAIRQLAP